MMNHQSEKPAFFAHESAYIDRPCRIGTDTEIGHFTHVMANSSVGARCRIGQHVSVSAACEIGDDVCIGENVALIAGVVLEDHVVCGSSVAFTASPRPSAQDHGGHPGATSRVKSGARIGANSTIMHGCTIGRYSLIEAGTVVNRDVPDYAIVSGNPMRIVGWTCECGAPTPLDLSASGGADSARCGSCERVYDRRDDFFISERSSLTAAPMTSPIRVPLLDLKPQYASIASEINAAIRDVCLSQQFILGPRVERLEQRIADYSQCRFGVGTSSGTDALLLALMALGVGPGDEVITTPYSFFATAGAVARLGARPLFCDIEPNTYNLSAVAVERFIDEHCDTEREQLINRRTGGRVKVLMPVHLYGLCADMDALTALAKRHRLRVVEDAAQAIGAETAGGRRAGSFGDVGCFSFFPSKNLGAFGDAGMCTSNDPELTERMRILRTHGAEPKYHHELIGANFRIDAIQAAVLDVKLNYLDRWTAQRQRNAAFYDESFTRVELDEQLSTPWTPPGFRHIYNQYTIRVKQRDELRAFLSDAGIGSEIYYPVPLHRQPCFDYLDYAAEDCPEANAAAAETLALPIYPELDEAQKRHVAGTIMALLR